MPKVGDRVSLTIRGEAQFAGTASVAPGGNVRIGGIIVEENGDNWVIRLDMSFGGRNEIAIPKSAYREAV